MLCGVLCVYTWCYVCTCMMCVYVMCDMPGAWVVHVYICLWYEYVCVHRRILCMCVVCVVCTYACSV